MSDRITPEELARVHNELDDTFARLWAVLDEMHPLMAKFDMAYQQLKEKRDEKNKLRARYSLEHQIPVLAKRTYLFDE